MSSKPSHKKNKANLKERFISQPLNFVHVHHGLSDDIHPSQDGDTPTKTLPPPCPGNITEEFASYVQDDLKKELVKSIAIEIRQQIREQFDRILPEITKTFKEEVNANFQMPCPVCKHVNDETIPTESTPNVCTEVGGKYINVADDTQNHLSYEQQKGQMIVGVNTRLLKKSDRDITQQKMVFSNPMYDRGEDDVIPSTVNYDIKYGNDSVTKHDDIKKPVPRPRKLEKASMPHQSYQNEFIEKMISPHSSRGFGKTDERECLARALQSHVEEMVDGIVFKESELPDKLTEDGILTEDECSNVRRLLDRKDQIRILLSLIKGRDFAILEKFLKQIQNHNKNLATSIKDKFESNKRDNVQAPTSCVVCKLKSRVNIKYVIDRLWKIPAIEDGLYNEVVYSDKPTGAQNHLWNELIDVLNGKHGIESVVSFAALLEVLTRKDHYAHLAKEIDAMGKKHDGRLKHTCNLKLFPYPGERASSTSSHSPRSSVSERRISNARFSGEILSEDDHEAQRKSLERGLRPSDIVSSRIQKATEERQDDEVHNLHAVQEKPRDDNIDKPPPLPQKKTKLAKSLSYGGNELHCSDV